MATEQKAKKKGRTLEQQIADLQARKDRDETKAIAVNRLEKALAYAKKFEWELAMSHADEAVVAMSKRVDVVRAAGGPIDPAKAAE